MKYNRRLFFGSATPVRIKRRIIEKKTISNSKTLDFKLQKMSREKRGGRGGRVKERGRENGRIQKGVERWIRY